MKTSTSGYKGVSFRYGKWRAKIQVNKKSIWLGVFDTKEKAATAYNEAAQRFGGEFAYINKLPTPAQIDEADRSHFIQAHRLEREYSERYPGEE